MRSCWRTRCPWSCLETIGSVTKRYLLNVTGDHSTGKYSGKTSQLPNQYWLFYLLLMSDLGMPWVKRLPRPWTTFCSSPGTTGESDLWRRPTLLWLWTSTWTSGRWARWTRWVRSTRWTVTSDRAGRTRGWATTRRVWTSWLSTGPSWPKSGCRTHSLSMENNLSFTK